MPTVPLKPPLQHLQLTQQSFLFHFSLIFVAKSFFYSYFSYANPINDIDFKDYLLKGARPIVGSIDY
jgi:hypothetical protein